MMDYLKAHWYWVVGICIGLWVLLKLTGSKASAGANVSTPGGSQIIYGGTNANDAAVQVAQLNNQTQLAGAQIAAGQAVQLAQYAVQANQDTQAAAVQVAGLTTSANVAMTHEQAARDVSVAQIQAAYGLDVTNSNNYAAMHVSDNATLLGINSNETNLAAVASTNAAKLAAYTVQGQVINAQTNAYRDIAITQSNNNASVTKSAIDNSAAITAQQLSNQSQLQQMTYQLEISGQLNKGGEGGVNQIAAWNALINPSSAAAGDYASSSTAIQSSNQISGIIGAIGNAVSEYVGAAAKAFA